MVNSGNLNGVISTATTDLEKREEEDLEEGETYQTEEGDLEKGIRGAASGTAELDLTEPLLTPEEAQHEELAAASKPLVAMEKVIVSLLVVCFVLVEAYFVGHSFRSWFDPDEHLNGNNTKSMDKTEFDPVPLPLTLPVLLPIDGGGGGVKETVTPSEHFDDISARSLDSGELTVRESSEEVAAMTETSTTMARLPQGVKIGVQMLVLPLMEEAEALISAENDPTVIDGGS